MQNNSLKTLISKLLHKFWESPTLMTWGSFLSKSLGLVVVLPLILTRFSTEEISLWYPFATIAFIKVKTVDVGKLVGKIKFTTGYSGYVGLGILAKIGTQ